MNEKVRTLDDLRMGLRNRDAMKDLPLEVKALYGLIEDLHDQGLIKDIPFEIIGEFTFAVVLKLARQCSAGLMSIDEATLLETARAGWDAIARYFFCSFCIGEIV